MNRFNAKLTAIGADSPGMYPELRARHQKARREARIQQMLEELLAVGPPEPEETNTTTPEGTDGRD